MSKIILFGGTFDPIHNGHLLMASLAYDAIQATHVIFIPCKTPVHKQEAQTSGLHRLEMIRTAILGHPNYCVDDIELKRDCASYTVTTLQAIKRQKPDDDLYWLIGTDSLQQFKTWHEWETILQLCHLIVIERPQYEAKSDLLIYENYRTTDFDNKTGKVLLIRHEGLDISSTQLRAQFWSEPTIRKSLPTGVKDYILYHHLYKKA